MSLNSIGVKTTCNPWPTFSLTLIIDRLFLVYFYSPSDSQCVPDFQLEKVIDQRFCACDYTIPAYQFVIVLTRRIVEVDMNEILTECLELVFYLGLLPLAFENEYN